MDLKRGLILGLLINLFFLGDEMIPYILLYYTWDFLNARE